MHNDDVHEHVKACTHTDAAVVFSGVSAAGGAAGSPVTVLLWRVRTLGSSHLHSLFSCVSMFRFYLLDFGLCRSLTEEARLTPRKIKKFREKVSEGFSIMAK